VSGGDSSISVETPDIREVNLLSSETFVARDPEYDEPVELEKLTVTSPFACNEDSCVSGGGPFSISNAERAEFLDDWELGCSTEDDLKLF
jgi:hypothetical protein